MEELKEAVRSAVSDIGGAFGEPETKVFSVLGKGGFGVVYHGTLLPVNPVSKHMSQDGSKP